MILDRRAQSYLVSTVYILSYVLYKTRYPLPEFPLYSLMLPLEIGVVFGLFFLGWVTRDIRSSLFHQKAFLLLCLVIIFAALLLHSIGMHVIYTDGSATNQIINVTRMFVYLTVTFLLVAFYFDLKIFETLLFRIMLTTVVSATFLFAINSSWFSESGYGFPRPNALLSEPSAFAPVVVYVFFASLLKKSWLGVIASITLINMLSSGTVVVVFALTAVALLVTYSKRTGVLLGAVFAGLVLINIGKVNAIIEESYLLVRVSNAIIETNLEKGDGGTARVSTLINLYGELAKDDRVFAGRGFNSAKAFFGKQAEYREFGLIHLFLFSFGLIGVSALLAFVTIAWFRIYKTKNLEFMTMYMPFVIASLINSAQGTVLHKFAYLFVLIALFKISSIKKIGNE